METLIGKAFGFFYCEAELSDVTQVAAISVDLVTIDPLELKIVQNFKELPIELHDIAFDFQKNNMNYAIELIQRNRTNKQASNELAAILNQMSQSPLYEDKLMDGAIIFEYNGIYILRTDANPNEIEDN